jgi:arylsulfatase A-like enzyme
LLQKNGYKTGLFGKWGLGDEGVAIVGSPIRQGFDEFYGYLNQHHAHNYWPTFLIKGEARVQLNNEVKPIGKDGGGVATKKVDYAPDLILQNSLDFITRNKKEPFFLYYSTTLPHANNEATKETGDGCEVPNLGIYKDKEWTKQNKAQAAMITYLDTQVGKILDHLKDQGLEQNTLVFFTSDNGPHKEGGNNPDFFNASGGLNGIKRSLHDGGIRVPFIVSWKNHITAGRIVNASVVSIDATATALELADAGSGQKRLDGINLMPLLAGKMTEVPERTLFWRVGQKNALRSGNWKLIRDGKEWQLYDLAHDIGETTNLTAKEPARVQQLTSLWDKWNTEQLEPLWR